MGEVTNFPKPVIQPGPKAKRPKRRKADWEYLRSLYENSGMSLGQLSRVPEANGVSKATIGRHAQMHDWVKHDPALPARAEQAAAELELKAEMRARAEAQGHDTRPTESQVLEHKVNARAVVLQRVRAQWKKLSGQQERMTAVFADQFEQTLAELALIEDAGARAKVLKELMMTWTLLVQSNNQLQAQAYSGFGLSATDDRPKVALPKVERRGSLVEAARKAETIARSEDAV